MSVWLAALFLAGAITATYLFCVRPMRRRSAVPDAGHRERELAELRGEVARLREESERA